VVFDSCDQGLHNRREFQTHQFEESGITEMLLSFKINRHTNPITLSIFTAFKNGC